MCAFLKRGTIVAMVLFCAAIAPAQQTATQANRLAVAGKLDVDMHADLMVSRGEFDCAMNWYNCGYSAGTFGNFGMEVPAKERADRYPRWLNMDGSPAVFFNGNDIMKGDAPAEDAVVGDEDLALELWVMKQEIKPGERVLGWISKDDKEKSASLAWPDFVPASRGWRHIVVNCRPNEERWYVDGELKQTGPRAFRIGHGHVMALGGDTAKTPSFLGFIAAVRLHEKAMTEEQIRHNHKGGVMLGTELVPNIDPKMDDRSTWGDQNPEAYDLYETKHFRSRCEKAKDAKNEFITMVPAQLGKAEALYEAYAHRLAIRMPVVSAKKELRGDGVKYKLQLANGFNIGAGGWMGWHGDKGFGYPISPAGNADGHELAHGCSGHMEGSLSGNYWEAYAGFPETYAGIIDFPPGLNNLTSMFFPAHGRNYYHSRMMFEHLAQTPEYGPMFVSKLWHEARDVHYPWLVFQKCNPPTSLSDEWNRMARRNITWDYKDHNLYQKENDNPDLPRYGRTILEPMATDPSTWRVPKELAPQQFGYNICPLQPEGGRVSALLTGYINPARGSDWRASFAAVSQLGRPRYGNVFRPGEKAEFELRADEPTLFLVVSATPTNIIDIDMVGDYRSFEQEQFVYKVKLEGCKPLDNLAPGKPRAAGAPHPNGGGFVAATAKVERSAYVGPKAQVLGNAQVLGKARIEDWAVVTSATVRDNAIVSGHAVVEAGATVRDHGKARDFGRVGEGSTVRDYAKVLEHAFAGGKKTYADYAVLKGMAFSYGNVRGSAMVDGSYGKSNEIDKGKWFTWSWAQGKNKGEVEEDFGGLYMQCTFQTSHPYLAWDDFGVTWGYLMNGATTVRDGNTTNTVLALNGKDQFVELQRDVADMHDMTIVVDVKWEGGKDERVLEFAGANGDALYLTPSAGGKCVFAIRKGRKEQRLKGPALPKGEWAKVMVVLAGDTGRLFIDGKEVKRNDKMTLNPEDVRATLCFLGRGAKGGYFQGELDNLEIYSVPLVDETPPSPSPAAFEIAPIFVGPGAVSMRAQRGTVPRGSVEYFFEETSGNPGGAASGSIKDCFYLNEGLSAGKTYAWRVKMRDKDGHVTEPSEAIRVKWEGAEAFQSQEGPDNLIVMEAEHFARKTKGSQGHAWSLTTDKPGYQGEGLMISLPNSGADFGADFCSVSPRLDYVVDFKKPGDYWIWLRGFGEHWTSDSVNMALDLKTDPKLADVQTGFGKYMWKRHGTPITVAQPGIHTVSIWMKEDGARLDRIVLTTNDGYKPTDKKDELDNVVGDGPKESPRVRAQ